MFASACLFDCMPHHLLWYLAPSFLGPRDVAEKPSFMYTCCCKNGNKYSCFISVVRFKKVSLEGSASNDSDWIARPSPPKRATAYSDPRIEPKQILTSGLMAYQIRKKLGYYYVMENINNYQNTSRTSRPSLCL